MEKLEVLNKSNIFINKIQTMKLNYLTILVASMLLSVYSCGPSKNIPQNEVVQTIPCEGKQYETTKDHFRASAQGVSPYQQMAKDIAIQMRNRL